MRRIFFPDSPYKKQARFLASLWTLLILVACFTPAQHIPHVNIPLIDKWTHFILFSVFTFLWLCVRPVRTMAWLTSLFVIATVFGACIELTQGALPSLGRSMELMDGVADSIGAMIGIVLFNVIATIVMKP